MAQFRNTADILDEILRKSGEPTNGNSPFESRAVTYANKAHHAIIGGGNVFDVNVDEPWAWARSRFPIVLELQPAFNTGAVAVTYNDINLVFSTIPSVSLEGWHFQINGKSTIYKITGHTASSSIAQIDSSFVDDSGSYNFRVFKLDYQIFPSYMYVDNYNDKVDFVEVGTASSTTLSATLSHGAYTPNNYIAHFIAKVGAAGTASYGGSFDSVLRTFNFTGSQTFSLLGATGANVRRSALTTLGLNQLDYTAAKTYTSVDAPNQVARLVEPFKLSVTGWAGQPFVYSSDPIKMAEDYPIGLTSEAVPDRFVRLTEESNGTIWVRFNAYPKQLTKVSMDWIPQPIDLQDNTASMPALPRGDVDTLIHAASAFIMFDKEDSKWQGMLDLAKAGLNAMKKKNHGALFRTGQYFGQMIPRSDMAGGNRMLRYGYMVNGGTASQTLVETTQAMISETLTYLDFSAASLTRSITASTLAANRTLFALIIKHSIPFSGSLVSAVHLDVGITTDEDKFITNFDVQQAVSTSAQDSQLVLFYPATATAITVKATTVGANLNALNAGSVTIYLQEVITE